MSVDATAATTPYSAPNPNYSAETAKSKTGSTPGIADNFQTFLTLLTTQLKNQNPMDPLDTNQFTQQLVQFAGIEQQLKSNESLSSLVQLQTTAQATQAMSLVGANAIVDGSKVQMTDSKAVWSLSTDKPVTAQVSIQSDTGQTVYSGKFTINAGKDQAFAWDGRGNDGTKWPDGNYTLSIVATDASGKTATVSTQIQGTIDSVDLSQTPPKLSIGGQTFTLDQINKLVRSSSSATTM
ncbi:flagellar basal-body rod modification protein FlgD [Rhodopseudomonas thermotolerans]|jgi:flagellar basal-body rod modification protein FlgD|uniref:Basal-body rod modification protein FlgD n=2 Tax=Rhodopseudomonas TaxID=1073 RepID=A0A336JYB2_9BRAD|nr:MULTISPECIES: flagellar hook capping FlgD N-terminal domain-containing protein [Rhodopseudomonas]RED23223.1 flagellar basal-body rod modification protein FlgD [Rhodopseudomonas pentothenatexigens]REF90173.1 flagellar basal-body rod modification protein FlgD [Rhodopseudomonas thermotolerans]SSW93356.1 flagellar basal-body rod modification protein FlgD [Rhodopseudomonas pentothenatexigens]